MDGQMGHVGIHGWMDGRGWGMDRWMEHVGMGAWMLREVCRNAWAVGGVYGGCMHGWMEHFPLPTT